MSETEPSWDLYGAFLAVMQGGSLSAAARELQVSTPAVSKRLAQLERHTAGLEHQLQEHREAAVRAKEVSGARYSFLFLCCVIPPEFFLTSFFIF